MPNVKTAISIDNVLFQKAEQIAEDLSVSRSRLYAIAITEFIDRYENKLVLQEINEALADGPDIDDSEFLDRLRRHQGSLLEDEW